MSIRPSYGRRSVLQVLSDGMSQRPPTGKSCCEEAALNAAEVDRLASERDTLQRCVDAWAARAEKVEAERDEWKSKYWGMRGERNVAAVKRLAAESARADLEAERDELQVKLDAAENRPTLDRDAVREIVVRESHGNMTDRMDDALTDAIMALALADAIDAEEAQRDDDDERIEEQAKELWEAVSQYGVWVNTAESARERCRAAIRAGWTKEDQ